MGEITTVPLLFFLLVLWAFFKYPPEHDNVRSIKIYNSLVLGLGALLWLGWYFMWAGRLESASLDKYKNLFGIGAGAAGATVYLGIFFAVRNLWIFADTRGHPGKFR